MLNEENMRKLTYEQRQEILDYFGRVVVNHVRDVSLEVAMNIAKGETKNVVKLEQYRDLASLSVKQKEAICDLLSETITDTIFNFLDMFERYEDNMRLLVKKDDVEYDVNLLSDKMGGEITFPDEDGWIQKFSKIGRFVY